MDQAARDWFVRQSAFRLLDRLANEHGDVLPFAPLSAGLVIEGVRVPLIGPQGIFKPAALELPLSITTAPIIEGKSRPYEDEVSDDGMLLYRYRGTDPLHRDNVGLREVMRRQLPLVYFHGIVRGQYL